MKIFMLLTLMIALSSTTVFAAGSGEASNNNQNSQKNKSLSECDDKKGNKKNTPSVLQTKVSVAGPAKASIASALNGLQQSLQQQQTTLNQMNNVMNSLHENTQNSIQNME